MKPFRVVTSLSSACCCLCHAAHPSACLLKLYVFAFLHGRLCCAHSRVVQYCGEDLPLYISRVTLLLNKVLRVLVKKCLDMLSEIAEMIDDYSLASARSLAITGTPPSEPRLLDC